MMSPDKIERLQKFLKENDSEIRQLHKIGISDFAIIGYVARIREGQSQEKALRGVLQGRRWLTEEQKQRVGLLLGQMSLPSEP